MNKRILYTQDDGTVAIIVPADCGLTIEQIAQKDVPEGKEYSIVDISEVPSDRTYRNAWVKDGDKIKVDPIKKAKIDEEKVKLEVDKLIQDKVAELAKKELIKDGILDENGNKIRG